MIERLRLAPDGKQALGKAIRVRRDRLKLSQQDIGDVIDQSQEFISRLENGHSSWPEPDVLKAIAARLGTTSDELLSEAGYLVTPFEREEMPPARIFAMAAEKFEHLPAKDREAAMSALRYAMDIWERRHGQ